MFVFFPIANLVMAEHAYASLIFTSFIDVTPLVCVNPKYLNWSTSSSALPFIYVLVADLGLMLLTRIMLQSELISMLYPAAIFSSLSMSCWSSSSLPPSTSMSANRKLHSGHPPMDTDDSGC